MTRKFDDRTKSARECTKRQDRHAFCFGLDAQFFANVPTKSLADKSWALLSLSTIRLSPLQLVLLKEFGMGANGH